jgi:iron(III) transport system permease protein
VGLINQGLAQLLGLKSVPVTASSLYGVSWVMGLMLAPVMFFLLAGPFQSLDPALEEAASMCGASRWFALRRIALPLVWPGILSGAIYVFVTAISIFEVPALLGGLGSQMPLLATELFYNIRPQSQTSLEIQYGVAGVYAVLMAVPSLLALSFYHRLLADSRQYEVVTGRGYRANATQLGRLRTPALFFVAGYLLLAVILPLLVLLWVSLLPVVQMPSAAVLSKLTFVNYSRILPQLGGLEAVRNSIVLMVSVALLTVFISFMISWVVVRTKLRVRFALDSLAMLPHAVPAIAYAFVLYIVGIVATVWLKWLPLAGSLAIIVIAHTITRLPYGTRMLNTALMQVHRELQEGARTCGAGTLTAMRRIVLPLVRPTIVMAATWTALLSLTELTMALFLGETDNRVLSASIWNIWSRGQLPTAAAAAVALVAVTGLCVLPLLVAGGRSRSRMARLGRSLSG